MFWYVTVMQKFTTVFNKQCMSVGIANALLKEMKEKYPAKDGYIVTKDWY